MRTRRAEWLVTTPSFLWLALFFAVPPVAVLADVAFDDPSDGRTLHCVCEPRGPAVASSTLRLSLDDRGRVRDLRTAAGVELVNGAVPQHLFALEATSTNDFTVMRKVDAGQAGKVSVVTRADGADVEFSGFAADLPVEKAVCRIRGKADDKRLRFGLETEMRDGWALTRAEYPRLQIVPKIGASAEDDAFASGNDSNYLMCNPSDPQFSRWYRGNFPTGMATQFCTLYDGRAGFVLAAEDPVGLAKEFAYNRGEKGYLFWVASKSFETGRAARPYEVTLAGFTGTEAIPCSWHDAADIYREWAGRQTWCRTSVANRRDLPDWMRDAPAMAMFKTDWFDQPERIHRWIREYWAKRFAGTPLVASLWGWERRGTWVGTDYFPCHPSDEAFRAITRDMRENGIHPYPWPSGYFWTLTYDRRPDGTFAFDDRARFRRIGAGHVICERNGETMRKQLSWLKGGEAVELCGGDPWTVPWVAANICRELAKRGCDVMHGDQINGGAFADCWSRNHPHQPGPGRWKVEAARAQLMAAREAIAAEIPGGGVVSYEEANETLDDLAGIQLVRGGRKYPKAEKANLYAYVNHGTIPLFAANPARGDYDWMAYSVVEGLMPRFVPDMCDLGGLVLPPDFFRAAREVETTGTNKFHYGENATASDAVFKPGRTFRLSADFETLARAQGARLSLDFGVYTRQLKSIVGGHLPFPAPGAGVKRLSCDFTMKEGAASILRIMLNSRGDAHGKVSNLSLEIVEADGSVRPACFEGDAQYDDFMRRWLSFYRGDARDFLMSGRHVKPPHVTCAPQEEADSNPGVPSVHVGAFETWDGRRRALVFANATRRPQKVSWTSGGERTLAPLEIVLLPR